MGIQVIGNTSFLGSTGYNNHSRNFFTHLNKIMPVRIRNYTYVKDISYLKQEERDMIIEQEWQDPPYKIGRPFIPNPEDTQVNIVLNESHHHYFYDPYKSPMIAYNVWEASRQMPEYFNRILQYDQFWCPTECQKQWTIDQGYPSDRVKVVPEGVNGHIFKPPPNSTGRDELCAKYNIPVDAFIFMIFGRWDTRKAIMEIVKSFVENFGNEGNTYLMLSADNPFSSDGMKSTEERLKHHGLENEFIKVLHFPPRKEYIQWMQHGDCLLSCSRSEGWNLPLLEAIACGTVSICSNWGPHLEFADGISYKVNVPKELPPRDVFMLGDNFNLGVWGEPDFDHLGDVMKKVHRDFGTCQDHALKMSKSIRDLYTWDNAAKKAEGYINELCNTTKLLPTVNKPNDLFETTIELDGGYPKVIFKSKLNHNNKLLVTLESSDGSQRYESWFDEVKTNMNYWVSLKTLSENLLFKIFDINNNLIHSEEKTITEVRPKVTNGNMELYQDQYINGEIVSKGKRECEARYNAMKQVFEKYDRPFTILDVGANFGYYSIRAATEYGATSIMVESEDNEIQTLLDLCDKNKCKDKLTVLQTRLDLYKLKELSKCEHFDVILALNIIHHFKSEEVSEVCEVFTKLGDNLILETPPVEDYGACGQDNLKPILEYFSDRDKSILGEFKRHTSDNVSELVWFKTDYNILEWPYYDYEKLFVHKFLDVEKLKSRGVDGVKPVVESDFNSKKFINPRKKEVADWIPGINLKTFIKLNGVYPDIYDIIEKVKTRNILGNYKWDNSNEDIMVHNFILNGTDLHMIDFDDVLIGEGGLGDEGQLINVINEIVDLYGISSENLKLNLGCGTDIKPGYVNIDRYNNTGEVDLNADLGDLPFDDGSVGEIYTSHVFEHIGLSDMYAVITEWRRVLRDGGKLVLRLPNLEHEVKLWLNAPDDKKWFAVHNIFGSQSHEGNTHLNGHNPGSLKSFIESFNFNVISCELGNMGYGEEIQCTAIKLKDKEQSKPIYNCHFVDGPFVGIKGDNEDKSYYQIDFFDPDNKANVHQHVLKVNGWTRPHRKWFTNWLVKIRRNGKEEFVHKFNLKGKNVLISMDSKSLGDTIAWMPYTEEFRIKHECNVYVSSFWNKLFKGHERYNSINFVNPGTVVHDLYGSYMIGCYDGDKNKNKNDWRTGALQKVASDTLGLDYKEIVTPISIKPGKRPIKEKYVTISEFSTFQCKFWNYPGGWQKIVNYLNNNGYVVMVISKEETKLKNVMNRTNKSIEKTITNIYHSEFFMGVSAGPSWLAWTLHKPVVLISGYSAEYGEFHTNVERIINKDVCHGCFNETGNIFDRGSWMWCPHHENTPRQFECTKNITPTTVIEAINRIRGNN